MAAQIASSQSNDGSQSRDSVGVSYANVVLNSKTMDSNKENINAAPVSNAVTDQGVKDVQPVPKTNKNNTLHKTGRQQNSYASASKSSGNNTEDFPQFNPVNVSNKNNTKRISGKQESKVKSNNANVKTDSSVADDSKHKPSSSGTDADVNSTEPVVEVPEKKKFVEAPLPKINPWTVNKNAASVITGKSVNESNKATANPSEKRVLQPHQQGSAG